MRIRTYPYRVCYIEQGDYYSHQAAGNKLPVFTKLVRATNSNEAKLLVKSKSLSPVIIFTATRHPDNMGKIVPVRWSLLTKQQVEVVEAHLGKPPQPVLLPAPAPLSVGGFTVGYAAPAGTVFPPFPLVAPPITAVAGVDTSSTSDIPPTLAVIPYVDEVDTMADEAVKVLEQQGVTPDDFKDEKVDWPSWDDHTDLAPPPANFFTEPEPVKYLPIAEADLPEAEVVTKIIQFPTPPKPELPSTKGFWIAVGIGAALISLGAIVVKAWR
jgi:hypothetical protein